MGSMNNKANNHVVTKADTMLVNKKSENHVGFYDLFILRGKGKGGRASYSTQMVHSYM
jgi:hypothetical protein